MPGTKENKVKTKLREGQVATVLGGLNTPEIIDYMGQLGFDGAWRETEQGTITWDQVAPMSRACDLWDMTSVCRVHHHEPWLMTRTLDVGATGRVVPHGSTKAAAAQAATSAKEGVAKVLMCYDRYPNEKNHNTRMMARRNDHPSAALPQLSRHRYCPPWEDPSRQATLLLP